MAKLATAKGKMEFLVMLMETAIRNSNCLKREGKRIEYSVARGFWGNRERISIAIIHGKDK